MKVDLLVVGAGFAGSVCSERLASAEFSVLVMEQRPYIAGDAFDGIDANGVLIHRHGPHIFHTNSERIFPAYRASRSGSPTSTAYSRQLIRSYTHFR
jgi:UDP-galactopyranose mutase